MKIFEQLERLKCIDACLTAEGTGNPDEFARKLNISRRCLYQYISFLKELGIEVQYSKNRRTFYKSNTKELRITFNIQVLSKEEVFKVNAGFVKENFRSTTFIYGERFGRLLNDSNKQFCIFE